MFRLFLVIVLLFSSVAVMAHGTLLYQQSSVTSMIAEEESTDQKSLLKEAKESGKEQIGFSLHYSKYASFETMYKTVFRRALHYSKGFYDKPYNPPDPFNYLFLTL